MIVEYLRPQSLDEALQLIARSQVKTVPLGGGTVLNQPSSERLAAVDLQALGLDRISAKGNTLEWGAMVTLQALLEDASTPEALAAAIRHEASYNLRQVATLAGTLVAAGGRSAFTTVLLAWDAQLEIQQAGQGITNLSLGDVLSLRSALEGRLITQVSVGSQVRLAYEYVARTPADRPIVCASVARWPSGRTRLALGGHGKAPLLAMDGPEAGGIEAAARNAYSQAEDEWASPEYRQETAAVLALRCLQSLEAE